MRSTIARRIVAPAIALILAAGSVAVAWWFALPDGSLSIAEVLVCVALLGSSAYITWQDSRLLIEPHDISSALQDANSGWLIATLSGQIIAANQKMASMCQQSLHELQHGTISSLVTEEMWQSLTREKSTLATGEPLTVDFEVTRPDGERRTLACYARQAPDQTGKAAFYILETTDVTHKQRARNGMKNSAIQLRRLLSKSSDMVVFTDSNLNITYANDNARIALTTNAADLSGKLAIEYINPSHRHAFTKAMEQFSHRNRNEILLEDMRLADKDDTPVTAHIIRLTAPEEPGFALIFGVMEHHLQALAASRAVQSRFSQVFHGTPDAILLLRASDTLILDFNEGFSRLLGYCREDAIGEPERELGFWANATERDAVIERIRNEREVIDYETTLRRADGTIVYVELSLRYVDIDNQLCMLCVGRDITKRISAEAALVESEQKFEKIFSESPDGIVILRYSDGVITDLNDALLSRSGYQRDELVGHSIYDFSHFLDGDDLSAAADGIASTHKLTNQAVTFYTKSGESIPSLMSGTIVELSGEEHVMIIAKDISKLRATEERLRGSEERFRGIFENAPFGIMLVDMHGRIFQANRTAADLLAYDEQHMYGIDLAHLVPLDDRQGLQTIISRLADDHSTDRSEQRMICQNGLEIWTNFHVMLQHNTSGEGQYYIVQIADITNLKRNQQRMERMAFYDTLTNLANRRLFHDRLEHAIEHCERANCTAALLYLDLDNFKRVNDTLGHQIGDNLLREVAARLRQCVRKQDTVGRTGGDEFTILLPEIHSPADAGVVAQKILNHLREPIHISGTPLVVTTSIGITVLPGDSLDPNVLMRNADLAMYKAKERGRNNYQFYSEDLNKNAVKRLRTEYEIRQALERNEFELYYQPKVSLPDRRVVGVESLIRWNHPERGVIAPDEFIGVAEDTGSIIEIGAWVIEEACRACQSLSAAAGRPIEVAINISPRQFRDPNLITTVRRSLRDTQLEPCNIELEITETMLMQDIEAAQHIVESISKLGVRLAIDDFGTGYSSLNYLKRFPINTVKVDRSFVMDIPSNADDMAITRAVIAMAHQLKMEVVAEGVETVEQLEFLAQHDCEYAQGWLFSKALPMDQIVTLLTGNLGMIHVG